MKGAAPARSSRLLADRTDGWDARQEGERVEGELDVSPTLKLPASVITQRAALLAVSGAGKSNAARAMAEEFFAARLPFVAVDPKGDWWGLRAGRDGTPVGGLGVVIFGGEHGDIPLERGGGVLVADVIVDERLSCVLDLSGFESEADKKAFLLDFARRLYHRNRDPLHLFLEEADDYVPQRPMKDELRLLRAFENIVRRGRTKGLGITLITQRSAAVNKNVLTQVETLFALRTTGPQDIKAIEAWMQYHGADRQMLASLAGLESGEAWVWSPHYLKRMERFAFRRSRTFDSGATPTNHSAERRRAPATLADVDLAALNMRMAETLERVAEDDPKALRRRISELEKRLGAAADGAEIAELRRQMRETETESSELWHRLQRAEVGLVQARDALGAAQRAVVTVLDTVSFAGRVDLAASEPAALASVKKPSAVASAAPAAWAGDTNERVKRRPKAPGSAPKGLGRPELGILGVLAYWAPAPVDRRRLALLSGYSPGGGSFNNYLSKLSTGGLIERTGGIALTREGRAVAPKDPPIAWGRPLVDYWLGKVRAPQRAILTELLMAGAQSKAELGRRLGRSTDQGAFNNSLSSLRVLGLVEGKGKELLRPAAVLLEAVKVEA